MPIEHYLNCNGAKVWNFYIILTSFSKIIESIEYLGLLNYVSRNSQSLYAMDYFLISFGTPSEIELKPENTVSTTYLEGKVRKISLYLPNSWQYEVL